MDTGFLDDVVARLGRVLPAGLGSVRRELEDNFRAVLSGRLEQLNLVSRERFDVQAELLSRTQQRLAALEKRLAALEQDQAAASGRPFHPPEPGQG